MKKICYLLLMMAMGHHVLVAQSDKLSPEALWKLGRVSLEAVSPDGKTVLYGVTYYDLAENKGNRNLYVMPVAGGTAKKITAFEGSEYNGRFRPNGKKIGFLHKGMLWEMNVDGSDKQQVSEVEMGGFEYSPAGTHIFYLQDVKLDKNVNDLYPDLPKAEARIIDDLMYRHWNQWHDYKYSHVFVSEYENGMLKGEPTDIMEGEAYDTPLNPFGGIEEISWKADGKGIAYTCKKLSGKEYAESTNSDIYLYEVASGKTTNLTEGMPGYDKEPVFSPDGKYMAWNSMERAGFESDRNRLFVLELATGKKTELSKGLDRDTNHPKWSADSKKIYVTTGEQATYQIGVMDVASKKFKLLTEGRHNIYGFAPAGEGLVCQRVSMSQPADLYRVAADGKMVQLTNENKDLLASMKMGKVEKRMIKTTDGKDMLTWVIYPPDFDPKKSYPTLLYCQGGPQSAVSQFFSYRWNFQLMAAHGYIVVAPNRRGLPSFGRAWNDQISGDWGGQAMQDYFSAIDALKKESYVDEDRLGAVGASFGGYSVYWLAGNHEKRFKAFISHCGLFNLESWYGTTEEMFFANFDIKGAYWDEKPSVSYAQHSPHKYVRNWDTPILVIHGEKDFRVPIGEGMQAFQAAQLQGVPSRFLYFPKEGHWVLSPQNGVLWHRVFFEWLDGYLK
ncbi:MAG: S9 family peptidase [Bacteroidota bacterium]